MSTLQRKIQQESRTNSRQQSRNGSRSSSRLGSRLQSDDEDEYTSSNFMGVDSDELSQSLDSLTVDNEESSKDKFNESLDMLAYHERKTSLEAREKALLTIVTTLMPKYEPERVNNSLLEQLYKAVKAGRSDWERMLAHHGICLCMAANPENTAETANSVLPYLFENITNESVSSTVRANFAYGYSLLKFFMLYGSGAFGAEDVVTGLIETADGLAGSDDSKVATACILGAGLVAGTMSSLNAAADDNVSYLVELLDAPSKNIKLAAGKLLAMFYQSYDYGDEDEDNSMDSLLLNEHDELVRKLRNLANMSTKKMGKKDKREQKSLFRDVLKTVEAYGTFESRQAVEIDDIAITHVKLGRSKNMAINSWGQLIIVQMYKWLFGPGIHAQVVTNDMLQDTIEEAGIEAVDFDSPDEHEQSHGADRLSRYEEKVNIAKRDVERKKHINKARELKIKQQMDEVGED